MKKPLNIWALITFIHLLHYFFCVPYPLPALSLVATAYLLG